MGVGTPDGGLGPEAFASCPTSDSNTPSNNVAEKENEQLKTKAVAKTQFEQNLNSPSHLRITINSEDKKIEIEQVQVTLVYKGYGDKHGDHIESTITEESSLTYDLIPDIDTRNCESHLEVTEFNVNATVEGKDEVTAKFPENNETYENVKVLDANRAKAERCTEGNGDRGEKEKENEDAVDRRESNADDRDEKTMREIENLTLDDNGNGDNVRETSSLILPTEEDKALFKVPALLLSFDYGSDEWRVREFGEIIILYRSEKKYQLQFRRYQHHGYETSLAMTLRASFKLRQMRYSQKDQAWEWTVFYITGKGRGAFQTLAAKFLDCHVANEFYNKIQECVLMLKNGGDMHDVNSEEGFLTPGQSIKLISRTSTPSFGVPRSKSADTYERSAGRLSAQWTSPISSKCRKIGRNASDIETGYYHEEYEYKFKRTRYSVTSPVNVENNTDESKVSLVYKCHSCGLCFDRPEVLLSRHLSKCSPTTKIVKTKCTCGLIFDQYNFKYHCEVHRKYTALNVKRVVVREEKNLDVSGMRKVFMENEMEADEAVEILKGSCDANVERSVKNDESNAVADIEHQNLNVAQVVKKAATASAVITKTHPVYVCQCRLCFDRAEFFIKHLSKCHLDAKVVKTTCICDLVFDKYNFAYHCEVHRRVTMLNVKYIIVRDEGCLDVSGMVQEFVEDEEIKVTETMKIELDKTVDQSLVNNPAPEHAAEQNSTEGNIENDQKTAENNDADSEDKADYIITQETEKAPENPIKLHENHKKIEEIIESPENKTDGCQVVVYNVSKEVIVLTELINGQNSEIPINPEVCGGVVKINDVDITAEEIQHFKNDTGVIESDNKTDTTKETLIKDDKNHSTCEEIIEPRKNKSAGSQIVPCNASKEVIVLTESINGQNSEIQHCNNDTDSIESDTKTDTAEKTLVKDEYHVEENIMNENVTVNKTTHDQIVIVVTDTINHDLESKENETINSITSDQEINETIKNTNENKDIKEVIEENKTVKNKEALTFATKEIDVTVEENSEEMCNFPNDNESHDKLDGSDRVNNEKDQDTVELIANETIDISIIEERQDYYVVNEPIESDKTAGDAVEQILVIDDSHVEKNVTKENEMEEKPPDHQIQTVAVEEHGAGSAENETLNSTQNTLHTKDDIQVSGKDKIEDNNEARQNEAGDIQKEFISATRETNVAIETCNVKKSQVPDKLESNGEMNASDFQNNQKHPNLLKSLKAKKGNDNIISINEKHQNISETVTVVSDKKNADNVKNDKKENRASIATNSNQGKTRKQGSRNANVTSNSKRSNKGKKP